MLGDKEYLMESVSHYDRGARLNYANPSEIGAIFIRDSNSGNVVVA